ncbi:putative bifunctional diguanylate cyclase/phosphodiesterase [Actinoplanes friuliensis]|uniref:Putative diguanylate cyclase/phosphodiesterase with PAS sensor n=1 Tax=Actinoplanes friuliensis DSM 7358 TaxID=1246995 RepID=U5VY20_9ACTN|nr:bifunctional diguanylate cyclase/phosphodiesterase [Actinoplanes friuliensis]AGZ41677.1 putative diguanylate cyclase/phosphodiesterase with PAS sensor [Actinoplanes friuliensis DSM 7358]
MTRHLSWWYVAVGLVLSAIYLTVPEAAGGAFAGMVVTTVAAILYGVRRLRPRRRLPWWLLAAGTFAFSVGSVIAVVQTEMLKDESFPSLADAVSLGLTFPLLLAAMLALSRTGAPSRDRASMIDSLILTAGAGFLAWVYLINPYLTSPDLTVLQKAVSVAYPLGDVLLLAILVRLALGAQRRWSVLFLVTSGGALLVSDIAFSLERLNGQWSMGGPIDVGWVIFFMAGGLAALHPSMVALTEPRVVMQPTEFRARRAVLTVASLIAPTVLFVEALRNPVHNGVLIAVVSAVLILLSLGRMSVVAAGLRRTVVRERELRLACETLLGAADVDEVERVVRGAVSALLRPGTPHRTVLILHGGRPGGDTTGDGDLRYVTTLPPGLAGQLDGFELALHCPLAVGGARVGDLYVGAGELELVWLHEAARVLAGQAASMIDRIALNREINKRDSEAYFRTLVLNATDVILIVDGDDRVGYASPSAQWLFRSGSVVGSALEDLIEPLSSPLAPEETTALYLAHRAGHEPAEVEVTIRDLRDEPTVAGRVLTLRDVTERRRLERELLERAYRDPLTGLGNRLRFQDAAQAAVTSSGMTGRTAGILLVNIDDFRTVNDTMGHEIGDELLNEFGRRLVTAAAAYGTVARLGADEFGVVVTSVGDVSEIEALAVHILTVGTEPFLLGGSAGSIVSIQPSIGVATTADAGDVHDLLTQADVALGSAKRGTPRWRRYEESMHARMLQRMQLRADLGQAITDDAFVLHFQPIVDLATGHTRGLEALVRWQHPARGLVPPLEFIEIAEESGLIVPLGDWVLRHAVDAAAKFRAAVPEQAPYMSVNVSVRQFRSAGFVSRVFAELARAGLPAELLTIEITESLLLGDDEQIHAGLQTLRAAGVKVSIDDFGTGYSSLSYLHRVDVDTLKLDKSFVDTIATSPQQYDLVRGIIQLAATLQLDVVAEGIETDQHRELLIDGGCAYGQGYLFARPLPEDAVLGYMAGSEHSDTQVTPAA